MRHLIRLSTALACFATSAYAADTYTVDKSHTSILFSIDHLGFSNMIGRMDNYDATLVLDQDNPENSKVDVTVHPSGVNTPSAELNKHLQGKDWFNTEKFPDMRFVSKSVKKTGADTADVTGDFTLLGVTKPVTLKVKLHKADYFQMAGAWVAGFEAETTIKRSEFGMSSFVPMVGDEVKITINTEFDNKEKPAPAPEAGKKH